MLASPGPRAAAAAGAAAAALPGGVLRISRAAPLPRRRVAAARRAAAGAAAGLGVDDLPSSSEIKRRDDAAAARVLRQVVKGDIDLKVEQKDTYNPFAVPHIWKNGRRMVRRTKLTSIADFPEYEAGTRRADGTSVDMDPRDAQRAARRAQQPDLIEAAKAAALKEGRFPWALVSADKARMLVENAHAPYLVAAALRNSKAMANDPSITAGCVLELRHGRVQELLGYGFYAGDAAKDGDAVVYPFLWTDLQTKIDDVFWVTRLRRALDARVAMVNLQQSTGYRLVNSGGDGIPGLTVDIFGGLAQVVCRRHAVRVLPVLLKFLREDVMCQHILIRDSVTRTDRWAAGTGEGVVYQENGLSFNWYPNPIQSNPLWHRASRAICRTFAAGRRVVDLHSSGGFAAHCVAGGAASTIAVSAGANMAEAAAANLRLAAPDGEGRQWEVQQGRPADWLRREGTAPFDLAVIDPPHTFVHKHTGLGPGSGYVREISENVPMKALAFLKDLNLFAMRKITPGGYIFTFCTAVEVSERAWTLVLRWAGEESGRRVQLVRQLTPGTDHPESLAASFGQSAYKGCVLRIT
eukprot:TRINITY_DN50264_c0_g1_i1.p1 TRINITY_DN50264_c0_g1~~TRINITY_DN50264_c0_g1_i1.p1  ORF type:complete len:602 (+),score=207.39 TRINITY_DN50264_c0_g1_i1:71-1807(+)